ncbi:MAG: serine hydrolase [Acidobacteriota bacterium]|nr:serine hydrolase [Acidobacteriota bacterium]
MNRPTLATSIWVALAMASSATWGQAPATEDSFGYHRPTEQLVQRGMQAFMICNGLFVSERPLELIYEQELGLNERPIVPPSDVRVDEKLKAVTVGRAGNDPVPQMRAAFREGLGCVVMSPGQTLSNLEDLPRLDMAPLAGDAADIDWPDGDRRASAAPGPQIDVAALATASDWAFDRAGNGGHKSQITLSLLVVSGGKIVHERYAPGVDRTTRTRTWSTAKSIAATLVGILVAEDELELDAPLPFDDWLPTTAADDPRRQITLRDVLQMSSGLYPIDNERGSVTGSNLSYFAGTSSVAGALDRGLVRAPGTHWDYENYDTLLAVHAMETVLSDILTYLEFPRRALLDRIGMRSTVPGVDRFGNFVLSSQVYTNARDLARFGLLYLNEGRWGDEQIIPPNWVDFVRTPAPATRERGNIYGAQFWLVPDDFTSIPPDAYSTAGNRGQYAVIVPSYGLVIVRRGLDQLPGKHRFSQWELTREVLKAFSEKPWGAKPTATAADR